MVSSREGVLRRMLCLISVFRCNSDFRMFGLGFGFLRWRLRGVWFMRFCWCGWRLVICLVCYDITEGGRGVDMWLE